MGIVRITDTILGDIADAIREKTGDSAQITPVNMASEIERISGGGAPSGEVIAFIRAIYDMNHRVTASKGNIELQSDLSGEFAFPVPETGAWELENEDGYTETVAVDYGHEYVKHIYNESLPRSNKADILISTWASEHTIEQIEQTSAVVSWSDLVLERDLTKIEYLQEENALLFKSGANAKYQLPSSDTSVTVYAITKGYPASVSAVSIALPFANSSGNMPGFMYSNSGVYFCTIYNTDTFIGIDTYSDWHVLALSIDSSNKKAYYYVDGVQYASPMAFNHSGDSIYLASSINAVFDGQTAFKYFGAVAGAEDPDVIIHNMYALCMSIGKPMSSVEVFYDVNDSLILHDSKGSIISDQASNNVGLFKTDIPRLGVWNAESTVSKASDQVVIDVPDTYVIDLESADHGNYLPSSTKANVLASYGVEKAFYDGNFFTFGFKSRINGGSYLAYDSSENALHKPVNSQICIDLADTDVSVTAYAVIKVVSANALSGILGIPFGNGNSSNARCDPSIFVPQGGTTFWVTSFGESFDVNTSVSIAGWHVLTISVEINPSEGVRAASFYIDGHRYSSPMEILHSGNYVCLGAFYGTYASSDILIKYFGVVDGCESPEIIIANHQHLMEEFGISGS